MCFLSPIPSRELEVTLLKMFLFPTSSKLSALSRKVTASSLSSELRMSNSRSLMLIPQRDALLVTSA